MLQQCSDKHALQIMKEIRDKYKLPKKRYISMDSYCRYLGCKLETVKEGLRKKEAH